MNTRERHLAELLSEAIEERSLYDARRRTAMEITQKYRAERDALRDELSEIEASMELHRKACDRARKLFMDAHGCRFWPDLTTNIVWLMEKVYARGHCGRGESCSCSGEAIGTEGETDRTVGRSDL